MEHQKIQPKSLRSKNPAPETIMPICFWCGNDKLENTPEKTHRFVMDYEPCEKCLEVFGEGIHVFGVTEEPFTEGMYPIGQDENEKPLYPTGSMFVCGEEWVYNMLSQPEDEKLLESVLKSRKMMMPEEIINRIIETIKATDIMEEKIK